MNAECLAGIVIDVCTRSFLLISDEGNERFVTCDDQKEFMNVLKYVKKNVPSEQIGYAELAINE